MTTAWALIIFGLVFILYVLFMRWFLGMGGGATTDEGPCGSIEEARTRRERRKKNEDSRKYREIIKRVKALEDKVELTQKEV